MRERVITLGCAMGALLLFATLFWGGRGMGEAPVSHPTTLERGDNGLRGAERWLTGEAVKTLSLRERFGKLGAHHELTATGNLMIVTLPAASSFRNDEVVALDRWIRAGNTLLVQAALKDRPRWAPSARIMDGDLQLLTGLEPVRETDHGTTPNETAAAGQGTGSGEKTPPERKNSVATRLSRLTEELAEPQRRTLVPNLGQGYFAGVKKAVSFSDYTPSEVRIAIARDGFALTLARVGENRDAAWWVRPDGAGTIIVSGFATLFTNRALGVADNAKLLANLVAATLGPQGTVIFDDQHQGLTAAYDPAKFYRDARLYATLGILALVWLIWVLGGTQLKMPRARRAIPGEAELVRTTGLFLARVLRPAAAARRMFEIFFQQLRVTSTQARPDPGQLWEWLENHPRIERRDLQQLQEWYAAAYADQRVPLGRLHNLLAVTERQIAA